ncbi:hypothetical protein D9M69_667600 [compost metagenome]
MTACGSSGSWYSRLSSTEKSLTRPSWPTACGDRVSWMRCATYQLARSLASRVCEPSRGVRCRLGMPCKGVPSAANCGFAPSIKQASMRPSHKASASASASNSVLRLTPTHN